MSDKAVSTSEPAILGNTPLFDQLLPIVRPTLPAYEALSDAVAELFETGMLTKGKYLREFEEAMADYIGVKHAVAVSSCTIGLLLTYQALELKGEAIVPSFTFMATVHPLVWNQVKPIFVDIDPETWNIDPQQIEEAISPRPSAIVAVPTFGNPADVEALEDIARRHGVRLVFDAAHGYGSLYKGCPVGGFGDAEVFSSSPTKLLVTGEGGMVTTNDDEIARRIRVGREYGNPGDYGSEFAGVNARMQEFSAILGLKSLEMLEENAQQRNKVAEAFRSRLDKLPGLSFQKVEEGNRSSYKDFSMAVEESDFGLSRDELAQALRAENIDTRKYHDPPVHAPQASQSPISNLKTQ
ncbi:MAG: DegT/DnrJ/EryC1/StrS family aminotransferase, partial [Anaerolineales bacterium]|nr:DegT/DnrJ/EryC1/StrS family aminotransferase [Anaerolineales bacterium]